MAASRLLLAALLPVALAAAALAQEPGGLGVNASQLAEELKKLLETVNSTAVGYGEAAEALRGVSACSPPQLSHRLAAAAEALGEGRQPRAALELAAELLREAAAGRLAGCSWRLVEKAVLSLLSDPTPLGLLPPEQLAPASVEALASSVAEGLGAGEGWEQLAEACRSPVGYALLAAALTPPEGPGELAAFTREALEAALAEEGLRASPGCVAAALLAAGARPPAGEALKLLRSLEAYRLLAGLPAWDQWEQLAKLYASGSRLEAAAAAGLLLSAKPWGQAGLAAACSLEPGAAPEGRLLLASLLRGEKPPGCSAASLLHGRLEAARSPRRPGPLGDPATTCGAYRALVADVETMNVTPASGAVEMLAAAASLCALETATVQPLIETLRLNPLAPLDPWVASLAYARATGDQGPAEAAWMGGGLGQAAAAGASGLWRLPLVEAFSWAAFEGSPLWVRVTRGEAARLAGGADPLKAAMTVVYAAAVDPDVLVAEITRSRGDPVVLGTLSRLAGLRPEPRGDGYIVDYATVRVVAWVLVKRASINFPNIVSGSSGSPLDPYYVIFTIPGRQRIILWSLGWVTTLQPPGEQQPQPGGAGGEEPRQPREPVEPEAGDGGREGGVVSPGEAAARLREAARLAEAAGLDEAAGLLEAAAEALERGDYLAAMQQLRRAAELLGLSPEQLAEAVARAAERMGLTPEEAARLVAEALSLDVDAEGRVRVDLARLAELEQALAGAAAGGGPGGSAGGGAAAVAEKLVEEHLAAARLIEETGAARVIEVTGVERLLGGAGGVLDVTGRILAAVGAGGGEGGALQPAAGGGASAAPEVEPPRGGPGWLLPLTLLAAAAAAAPVVLLAARTLRVRVAAAAARRVAAARLRRLPREAGDARSLYAALVEALGAVYRERRPWETHREYGRGLRGELAAAYREAAAGYEEARFGGRVEAVERLRRAAERLARLLSGGGGGGGG